MAAGSGFLPPGPLLHSLIHVSDEVCSMEKLPFVQQRNVSAMIRRIRLLSSLFEEIQDSSNKLPPSSILCFTELFSVLQKTKLLIQVCKDSSSLWSLIQTERISEQFHVLAKEMGRALDILPLSLLSVTADTREQVELLRKQAKRAESIVDSRETKRKDDVLELMAANNEKNSKNKGSVDLAKAEEIFTNIGLRYPFDYEEEIARLETEVQRQAGTGGLIAVSNINNLISLVSYSKSVLFSNIDSERFCGNPAAQQPSTNANRSIDVSAYSLQVIAPNIPDEFRCPISLDLMRDPVIVSSGHTYDRNSIAQWINSGHHTCPKSGQRLIHMALIPNYALKSLVHQWCQENNIQTEEYPLLASSSSSSGVERSKSWRKSMENAIDHISAAKAVVDAVKMTAEFLVGKLATGSLDIQRQAAYELRLLAKTGMDNRRIIAEAGAIPFLVTLLTSQDARIQENAVTALLNLSIHDNNKILIVAAGAVDHIIATLEVGKTMEARENAAASIFSLSMLDDCKVIIGAHPKAISALVGLLRDGTTAGKRDASTALLNLAVYNANKASVVTAGAVSLLIDLLMDDKAGITDDALSLLALLLGCPEGLQEIRQSRVVVPLLVDLLRFGSQKGKENSITLLLGLCKDGEEVAGRLLMNPRSIPSLRDLAVDGSLKARRKADALLRLLNRCCSHSRNPIG
ncbi:hypothetical protein MLD38_011093 [Melastoma candidum]|uniref:Uncharacterized protein n=1 Tax=Melastoma candidum TaxID=119954 RepID=A0ACB9R1M1_9MYRT|nr:hypothetical protein MLD38_011093 [Melastoma candidum]